MSLTSPSFSSLIGIDRVMFPSPLSNLTHSSTHTASTGPLTTLVKRTLSVSNHNSDAIAYKVKTTAPKQYCVRPNSGRIEPGETVEVQVLLQPMKEDPPSGTKCRDKFLVQSVVITQDRENVPLADLVRTPYFSCYYYPCTDQRITVTIVGYGRERKRFIGTRSTNS